MYEIRHFTETQSYNTYNYNSALFYATFFISAFWSQLSSLSFFRSELEVFKYLHHYWLSDENLKLLSSFTVLTKTENSDIVLFVFKYCSFCVLFAMTFESFILSKRTKCSSLSQAGVALDSHLLLGKLFYTIGNYEEALNHFYQAELHALTEKSLPSRSIKIVAESYAIKGKFKIDGCRVICDQRWV